jgi:DNA-directed RNA polymerase subunit RPC12/RpoP
LIYCTRCATPLNTGTYNSGRYEKCPRCGASVIVYVFPAFYKDISEGSPAEALLIDNEASCYYHPDKKAVIPCSICGRFLCALCDVEFNEKHICISCLESSGKDDKISNLENHRVLYDSVALWTAILPMLFFFVTIITAPLAIFMVFRYWKAPSSIVSRTKLRFILAFIFAGLQIAGWAVFILS